MVYYDTYFYQDTSLSDQQLFSYFAEPRTDWQQTDTRTDPADKNDTLLSVSLAHGAVKLFTNINLYSVFMKLSVWSVKDIQGRRDDVECTHLVSQW